MKWKTAVKKEELKQDVLTPEQKINIIKEVVCGEYGASWEFISKKGRQRPRVFPKQVFMYFSREFTKDFYPRTTCTKIADYMEGERKRLWHTTILHAVRLIDNIQEYDKDLRTKIETIRQTINIKLEEHRQEVSNPVHM